MLETWVLSGYCTELYYVHYLSTLSTAHDYSSIFKYTPLMCFYLEWICRLTLDSTSIHSAHGSRGKLHYLPVLSIMKRGSALQLYEKNVWSVMILLLLCPLQLLHLFQETKYSVQKRWWLKFSTCFYRYTAFWQHSKILHTGNWTTRASVLDG